MEGNMFRKGLVIGIIVLLIGMCVIPSTANIVVENNLLPELIIDGPTDGKVGIEYDYMFILIDPEGCDFMLWVDWDDGTNTEWMGPYAANEEIIIPHTWYECGIYTIQAVARCNGSGYNASLEVTITDNHPPDAPKVTGPYFTKVGIPYECTIRAIDPDGDNVSYQIDWADGDISEWTVWYPSGEEITQSHYYSEEGHFSIRARAKDIHGAIGNWGDITFGVSKGTQQSSTGSRSQNTISVIPLSRTIINNGSLSGYVNDTSGNPMEGALVRVYFHGTYEENYSDSNGYYHVTNIPICWCYKNCTASKEGYETEWVLLGITENTTFDFVLYPLEPYPVFNGTMGWNGWWVSPVTVSFVFDPEEVAEIWYNYYGWHLYTEPFVVGEEGNDIPIDYYWVNYEGEQSPISTFYLDIDQTHPVTNLTWLVHKVGFIWCVKFILTAEDALSGMSPWLEIYINDLLLGEFEVLDWPTAEFEIKWYKVFKTVKFGFGCYDNAGNLVIESVNGSDIKSYSRNQNSISYQSNNMWLLRFLERFPILQKIMFYLI